MPTRQGGLAGSRSALRVLGYLWCSWVLAGATAVPRGAGHPVRPMLAWLCPGASGDGPGTHLAAGCMPQAGVGVPTASDSRPRRRRRGGWARHLRPPHRGSPGRRRAAPRSAPTAPRSAIPGQVRARSPPTEPIEPSSRNPSTFLHTATGASSAYKEPARRKRCSFALIPAAARSLARELQPSPQALDALLANSAIRASEMPIDRS